jgi:ABC-2 type transport system permease protein
MSTDILASPHATSPQDHPAADDVRLTFARVVRSEWIKLRTLRSTIWTLAITLLLMVGIVTLFSAIFASEAGAAESTDGDGGAIIVFMIAASMAQLAVAVLAVLVVTGEYTTGMIRSTLAAVPQRLPALWAKGVVLAASILVVSAVAVAISLGVMQIFLGSEGFAPDLGSSESVRILLGTVLYLTAIALFAFAIGAILRHSAGALATVLGLLLVVENLFQIPWKPLQLLSPFLPGTAGMKIMTPQVQIDAMSQGAVGVVLGPWQGLGVLLAWVAVLLTAAAVLIRRRDA